MVDGVQASAIINNSVVSRIAAAAVMMPLTIGLTWMGGLPFALLLMLCAGLMAREWTRLCGAMPDSVPGLVMAAGSVGVIAGTFFFPEYSLAAATCIILYFVIRRLPAGGLSQRGHVWLAAGALAIIPTGLSLLWLRTFPADGLTIVLWLFAVVWATDIAAYAVGKSIGGPRLVPTISPNKTWAGLLGGLGGAMLVGFLISFAISGEPHLAAALAGLVIGLAANTGDIFESFLKRRFDAKDSGGLIPGHGGVLDRLDSLLAAAPAAVLIYNLGWRWL